LDAEEAAAGENDMRDSLDSVTKQISSIAISESPVTATPSTNVVGTHNRSHQLQTQTRKFEH
jgi:hypothetical protein